MKIYDKLYSRREMLKSAAGLAGAIFMAPSQIVHTFQEITKEIKIGACDWSIGKMGDVSAFALARDIGLDGLQISFARNERDVHLLDPDVQMAFQQASRKHNVEIGGLALGILNQIPYKSDPRAEKWVSDSIDVAEVLGCRVVLLAFFGDGDIKGDKEGTKEVIRRLKKVAPKAEDKNIILGIESWLSAEEHIEIIDAVGSDHVRVYYDVANSHHMGYDIYKEIRWLGNNHICEFHAKENGYLLGEGKIKFPEVQQAINEIGYSGWIQIEGAVPPEKETYESYLSNTEYLRSLFD